MILLYVKYLFFKLKATNQHGVHSPYLYALVCSCFYNSNWKSIRKLPLSSQNQEFFYQCITKQLQSFIDQSVLEFRIEKPELNFHESKTLIEWIEEFEHEKKPHITLINNLHQQRKNWNSFVSKNKYVYLDFFFYGIVIHRFQQRTESFFLKIF